MKQIFPACSVLSAPVLTSRALSGKLAHSAPYSRDVQVLQGAAAHARADPDGRVVRKQQLAGVRAHQRRPALDVVRKIVVGELDLVPKDVLRIDEGVRNRAAA